MAFWRRRPALITALAVVLVVGAAIGGKVLWDKLQHTFSHPHCTFGRYEVTTDQAALASTMVGVVTRRELPERAAVLVIAAAYQESKLTNLLLGEGDRDSVGVLQQRPSQGWGTPEQINDVKYATGRFLDALVKVDGWQTMPLSRAIQSVQISADEEAYNQHAEQAQQLADALLGTPPAALTCQFGAPAAVATPEVVSTQLARDLPVNPKTTAETVTVSGARWQTVAWFVANADRLGIDSVAYSGKMWTRAGGWKENTAAGSAAVVAVMAPRPKESPTA